MYRDCSARPAQPDVLKTRVLSKALCPLFSFFFFSPLGCTDSVFAFFFKEREREKSENLLSFLFQSAWTNEKQTRKDVQAFVILSTR